MSGARSGQPVEVHTSTTSPDKEQGKAIPYGVYDLGRNEGWVSVGIIDDTGQFAVNSIRSWWQQLGKSATPTPAPDDHGRLRRLKQHPRPALEDRAATARRRDRPHDPRLPLPARHQQVEQNRAPAFQLYQQELARQAAVDYETIINLIAAPPPAPASRSTPASTRPTTPKESK